MTNIEPHNQSSISVGFLFSPEDPVGILHHSPEIFVATVSRCVLSSTFSENRPFGLVFPS